MKSRKGLSLALAAGILVSGAGLTTALATAGPAQAFTVVASAAIDPSIVKVDIPTVTPSKGGTDGFTLTWTKPKVTGTLTGYKVIVKQGAKTVKTYTLGRNVQTQKVTGLLDNTRFDVFVEAHALSLDGKNTAHSSASWEITTAMADASYVSAAVPISLKANANASTVAATWVKPYVHGKLLNYTVTVRQGAKIVDAVTTTGTKASFTKLKENTSYKIYVRANAASPNGRYKASSGNAVKTVKTTFTLASTAKAAAPASLKASTARTSVTVSWKRPAHTGFLKSYTVVLKQGTKTVKTFTQTGTTKTIKGLKANTAYKVYVKTNVKSKNGKYSSSSTYAGKTVKTKR